jgi:ribosomal protein S6--L-glutamate ligase
MITVAKSLVLVNAEEYWDYHFTDYEVHRIRLQTSRWMLRDGKLRIYDPSVGRAVTADALFWRLGATRPFPNHRTALELARYSQIPCVNSAEVLLKGLDRLSMLNELRTIGLPVVPFTAIAGPPLLSQLPPQLPSIIKVGSYHAGYGKMKLSTLEQWQDMVDFVFITEDYLTIEPYIDYVRDVRCLAVGDQVWAMARNGSRWKANSGVVETQLIAAPPLLYDYTLRTMQHFGADVLALDFLETQDGQYVVLESNDVPGMTGFPDYVNELLASRMKAKIEALAE